MSDHQQQCHPGRQQRPPQEDEEWYDEQGGGASIEDETWPPRTRTSDSCLVGTTSTNHSRYPGEEDASMSTGWCLWGSACSSCWWGRWL